MREILILFLALLFIFSCEKPQNTVISRFDDEIIELADLKQALSEAKIRIRDPKIAREKLLDEMINLKLLAKEARKRGIELGESEKLMITAYRDNCLREVFYQQKIEPTVEIEKALLEEVGGFRQMRRHLQYLIFVRKSDANDAYQALQQGERFEKLIARETQNSVLPKAGGDWGWKSWDDLEFKLAMPAFRLKVGEFSKPIAANNWIYILKVVEIKPSSDFHADENLKKTSAEIALKAKLGEQKKIEYVNQLMKEVKIQVRADVLNWVSEKTQNFFNYKPAEVKDDFGTWQAIEASLWENREAALFLINDSTYTVGRFLSGLSYIPVEFLQQNFKLVLDYAIRDYYLGRHAESLGLAPVIEKKVRYFADRQLVKLFEKKLEEKFSATDREIQEKYNELKASGKIQVSLEEAKPLIARHILQEEGRAEAERMARHIRENKDVYINYQLLHEFE